MTPKELKIKIEQNKEIRKVVKVLAELESLGLKECSVASGFTRGFLLNTKPSDIDIKYYSDVPYEKAKEILESIVNRDNLQYLNFDIEGIWNVKYEELKEFTPMNSVEDKYLAHFVNSIDTIYLSFDGNLYDPTGFGFADALSKTLRMNDFIENKYNYPDHEIVYLGIKGIRRIIKFDLKPTERSNYLISYSSKFWNKLNNSEKEYFYDRKIKKKYSVIDKNNTEVRKTFEFYGYDFDDLFKGID